jgi:hypothetical protein
MRVAEAGVLEVFGGTTLASAVGLLGDEAM